MNIMGKIKKELKLKSKKVVFYDDENPAVKKMSVDRQRDFDGDVLLKLECPDGIIPFWLSKVQIQAMIDVLTQARGEKTGNYEVPDFYSVDY